MCQDSIEEGFKQKTIKKLEHKTPAPFKKKQETQTLNEETQNKINIFSKEQIN